MPRFAALTALLLTVFLAACTRQSEPVLGVPVALDSPTDAAVAGPRLSTDYRGKLVLSWMEPGEPGASLRYARFTGTGFTPAETVATDPAMFVNWADLPSVLSLSAEHWMAHWLSYSADLTYSYDVVVSQSFDGGSTWSEPVRPHTDETATEHGFVSMHPDPEGVSLLWLDGRETPGKAMTLRSAVITEDGERVREQLVDDSVCDCCQTDVAVASSGAIAVYRDRTAEEIRDIYISRFIDGRWLPGRRLHADNWRIAGCPVNGPSIVARGEFVAVAWFSAANDDPVVRVVLSRNAGETFDEPIEIARGRIAGYVGLALLDDSSLAVSWVGKSESGTSKVNVRHVVADGRLGQSVVAGETRQLRVFPQLGWQDGHLLLVWTDDLGGESHLKIVLLPASTA